MSAISGAGSNLFQYLQQLSSNSPASTIATAPAGISSDTTTTSGIPAAGTHHHHGGHGGGMKKLQDAVTSALQSAQQSGSSSDPNQVIEDAITKFLKGSMGATGTSTSPGTDPDATDAAGSNDPANGQSSFAQTLQSFGVTAQQFHDDFLAALKDAQGSQMNPTTAFQNFPPGSLIDEIG